MTKFDVRYAVVTFSTIPNNPDLVTDVSHKSLKFEAPDKTDVQVHLAKLEKVAKKQITVESVSKS